MMKLTDAVVPSCDLGVPSRPAERQPVTVKPALHGKYKMYSDLTNKPLGFLVDRALDYWFENVGEVLLEEMRNQHGNDC